MARCRFVPISWAVALVLGAAASFATSPALALPKTTECQRPLSTGEEVYNLKNVSVGSACPVVRALGHWEYHPTSHITKLYTCVGPGKHTPKLRLHDFDGWTLSITRTGAFRLSRGSSSFDVIGTDFPLNCS